MNHLRQSLAVKVTAIFLFVITTLVLVLGITSIFLLDGYNFYGTSLENAKEAVFEPITRRYANDVFYNYFPAHENKTQDLHNYEKAFSADKTNFLFIMKNEKGETVLNTYTNQEYQFSRTYYYEDGEYRYDEARGSTIYIEGETYTIECFVNKNLTAEDNYLRAVYWINLAYPMRYTIIIITALSLIIAVILFIFLMCSAGRRKDKEGITPNGVDKIPFDVFMFGLLITAYVVAVIFDNIHFSYTIGNIIFLAAVLIMYILLFLLALMSFATRYKLGQWWKNTVAYRFLYFNYKILRHIALGTKYLLKHISLLWKAILGLAILSFVELLVIILTQYHVEGLLFMWFLEKLILVPAILYIIIGLQKLQVGSQKIANGDLEHRIDTRRLLWDFKRHGENLNNISAGISKAVEERMKSERFKTELITNVSHDIKTPLTSIINYVDLIKREKIEEGTIKDYIDVLDRQSSRLKKLIDDLVEASKASTGNLVVNSTSTEVGVLLTQTIGEYEEKLKDRDLELILSQPEEEVFIMADGRLLWRVFDNLMNNICKYSQSGTRVYLNMENTNGQAVITFKNISKYALNITSDELLERFVRGDSSRTTEGSGLGLSIAKSLVELQKGTLELVIDGDLFKVIITFSIVQ